MPSSMNSTHCCKPRLSRTRPLDVLMLDGYLVGVLVQPRVIGSDEWLPPVFDLERHPLAADVDATWLARCRTLIERRLQALNAAISEDGWFDPLDRRYRPRAARERIRAGPVTRFARAVAVGGRLPLGAGAACPNSVK